MSKTISQIEFEENKSVYELEIYKLQRENLRLSNRQLRKYWLLTIVSFLIGVVSTIVSSKFSGSSQESLMRKELQEVKSDISRIDSILIRIR